MNERLRELAFDISKLSVADRLGHFFNPLHFLGRLPYRRKVAKKNGRWIEYEMLSLLINSYEGIYKNSFETFIFTASMWRKFKVVSASMLPIAMLLT